MDEQNYQQNGSDNHPQHELEMKYNAGSSAALDPRTGIDDINIQEERSDRDHEPDNYRDDSPAVPDLDSAASSSLASVDSESFDEEIERGLATLARPMVPKIRFIIKGYSSSSNGSRLGQTDRGSNPEPLARAPTPRPRGRPRGRAGTRLRSRVGISNHECRMLRDGTLIRGKQGATFAGFVPGSRTPSRVPPPPYRSPAPSPPPPEFSPPPDFPLLVISPSPSASSSPSLPPLTRQKKKKVVRFASPLEQFEQGSLASIQPTRIGYDADEEENEDEYSSSFSDSSNESPGAPEPDKGPECSSTTALETTDIGAQRLDSSACKRSLSDTADESYWSSSGAQTPAKKTKPNTE